MSFRFREFPLYIDIRGFIIEIYKISSKYPKEEKYSLSSQLNRAVTSILLNFAEGAMRKSDKEFNRFILIAIGSLAEVSAILDISFDLKYISSSTHKIYMLKCETLAKRLYGFSNKLRKP